MKLDPDKHRRRSIRLQNYGYSERGWYYVTICTENKSCLFGRITNDEVIFTNQGCMARDCWLAIPCHFDYVELDQYVIMPNHIHGIIHIVPPTESVGARHALPSPVASTKPRFGHPPAKSLSSIVGSYKSAVTRQVNQLRGTPAANFWQRNYYEHIIRNGNDLAQIREYIRTNPAHWKQDDNYAE